MADQSLVRSSLLRRADALLLAVLVIARIRIDTLAEAAVLPLRQNDVARHPWLGHLLPPEAARLLAQQQLVDPVGLLLIVGALGALLIYLLVDEFLRNERARYWIKLASDLDHRLVDGFRAKSETGTVAAGQRPGQLQPRRGRNPDRSHD